MSFVDELAQNSCLVSPDAPPKHYVNASWALTYFKEALAETLPVFLNSKGKLLTKFGHFAAVVNETIGNNIHTGDAAEELRQAGFKSIDISGLTSQRKDLRAAHEACLDLAPGNRSWETLFYLPFKGEVNLNIPNVLKGETGLIGKPRLY